LPFSIPGGGKSRQGKAVREKLESLVSPVLLETYVKCPLQFYFRKVLGLSEREEVVAKPKAADRHYRTSAAFLRSIKRRTNDRGDPHILDGDWKIRAQRLP
jgi:hypothetical protein